MCLEDLECPHLSILVSRTLLAMASVSKFQIVANIFGEVLNRIQCNVLVNVTRHARKSIEQIGEIGVDS